MIQGNRATSRFDGLSGKFSKAELPLILPPDCVNEATKMLSEIENDEYFSMIPKQMEAGKRTFKAMLFFILLPPSLFMISYGTASKKSVIQIIGFVLIGIFILGFGSICFLNCRKGGVCILFPKTNPFETIQLALNKYNASSFHPRGFSAFYEQTNMGMAMGGYGHHGYGHGHGYHQISQLCIVFMQGIFQQNQMGMGMQQPMGMGMQPSMGMGMGIQPPIGMGMQQQPMGMGLQEMGMQQPMGMGIQPVQQTNIIHKNY